MANVSEKELHLQGQVAMVTGGTRGIGKAIALRMARDGADVILNYKSDEAAAREAAEEIEGMGRRALLLQADMRKPDEIRDMFKELGATWDQLNILVHNAAFGTMGPILRIGRFSWNATFETNVTAMLLLVQQAHKWLARDGGNIIGISSEGARTCFSEYTAIGTSKAALEALIRYMAFEFVRDGIRVNSVSAGPVETRAIQWFKYPQAVYNFAERKSPMKRIGKPEDLAGIVSFLCHPDAAWIVGQNIIADGGIMLGVDFKDWLD